MFTVPEPVTLSDDEPITVCDPELITIHVRDPTPEPEPEPAKEPTPDIEEEPVKEPTPPPKTPTPEPEPPREATPEPPKEPTPPPLPTPPPPPKEPTPPPPKVPTPPPLKEPTPPLPPKEPTPQPPKDPSPEVPPSPPKAAVPKRRKKPVKKALKVNFKPPAPPVMSLSPIPVPERELSFEFEIIRDESEPEPSPSPVPTPREWVPPSPLPPTPPPPKPATPPPEPVLEPPAPRKRRPPPKKMRNREKKKRVISASAPVTKKDLKQIDDPLDYLSRYCIIHPDRLPVYERVFSNAIAQQDYKHDFIPVVVGPDDVLTEVEINELNTEGPGIVARELLEDHEKRIKRELELIRSYPQYQKEPGTNVEDFEVAKITYILNHLYDRYDEISERMDDIELERRDLVLAIAKKKFPELKDPDWDPNSNKKVKKKTKMEKYIEQAHHDIVFHGVSGFPQQTPEGSAVPEVKKRRWVTDKEIMERLEMDPGIMEAVCEEAPIRSLDIEADRCSEKLKGINERMDILEDERKVAQVLSKEMDEQDLDRNVKPGDFRRKQSALFNKFNPDEDLELNFEEVEDALRQINGHLISKSELLYIYNILDLPGKKKINLKMFGCVAALSEKVAQVDPFIKKLINKFDYEALDIKMERSKELFCLLCDEDPSIPDDLATVRNLMVELSAGGLAPENIDYVRGKFDRNGQGTIEYLDYLTYVPLFIEIHGRIVSNPLDDSRQF